jgi:hypothetical protein
MIKNRAPATGRCRDRREARLDVANGETPQFLLAQRGIRELGSDRAQRRDLPP